MNAGQHQQNELRRYLLGLFSDERQVESFEERIMKDDGFSEILSMAEDDLIDDYLGGHLPPDEKVRFTNYFMVSEEREKKLRFARELRSFAAKSAAPEAKPSNAPGFWAMIFASHAARFAAILFLFAVASFIFWRTFVFQSDAEKGLAELRRAYKSQRPNESRNTLSPEYVPYIVTRGEPNVSDPNARDRARLILASVQDPSDPEVRHALGLLYLNERDFDKSLAELQAAEKLDPANARILTDLGAAAFEIAKKARNVNDGAASLENVSLALKYIERALTLEPNSREARFNRALALQFMPMREQAKQAWRDYLELDSSSDWATEARRNLSALEAEPVSELSADDLEREFIAAVERGDEAGAWRLLSGNRELVRDKYLPTRLSMSVANALGDDSGRAMSALGLAGRLEETKNGDAFGADLAKYYRESGRERLRLLRQPHSALRDAYRIIGGGQPDYSQARAGFESARDGFSAAGDLLNAKLSDYLVGYCLINEDRTDEARRKFEDSVQFAKNGRYRWFEATATHWLAGIYVRIGQPSKARAYYAEALKLARELDDQYAIQRNSTELAKVLVFLGERREALNSIAQALVDCARPDSSGRQRYRNLANAFTTLAKLEFFDAARPVALESVALADQLDDAMFKVLSRNNAALALVKTNRLMDAAEMIDVGSKLAESISDPTTRDRSIAYSFLSAGSVARQLGDLNRAQDSYDRAAALYARLQMPAYLFEAKKGSLLTLIANGKKSEAEQSIPDTLASAEAFRERILDEQDRTRFFDREQNIYDIATDFEFSEGNHEAAYDYAERSNSRSLLDWLHSGKNGTGAIADAQPKTIREVRSELAANVQIIQYSVLEKRTLIWLISRESFVVRESVIGAAEISENVDKYLRSLRLVDRSAETDGIGRNLYDKLIGPVRGDLDSDRTVCIVPNKILFFLPFAPLKSPDGQMFVEEFAHVYAPGATAFLEFTKRASEVSPTVDESLLAVGNPAFDARSFESLPPLPSAMREVSDIARLYPVKRVLAAESATKKNVLDGFTDADVIHIAGHYVVRQNAPLTSFLLLAGGADTEKSSLTNSEIAGQRFSRARLVVLSACQTGVEEFYNGEGMVGLSRTFLAAGVPQVVASQWPVDSEATADLMTSFHRIRRKEGLTTVAALRKAQLGMANDPSNRFRSPYYWAAFAVFGGQAQF